eukprot:56012_1
MLLFGHRRFGHLWSVSGRRMSQQTEEWIDIPGFSKYQISSLGNFKKKQTNKLLKINYDRMKRANRSAQMVLYNDNGKSSNIPLARTVLSTFYPIKEEQSGQTLYACHIDGDKYNNKLSNLEWRIQHRIKDGKIGYTSPIRMTTSSGEILQFSSRANCKEYLESLSICVTVNAISQLCRNRSYKFGFWFTYVEEWKYEKHVTDLPDEMWQKFASTPKCTSYFVSNEGRIKSVKNNGNEKLISSRVNGGYVKISGSLLIGESSSVHKIVAKYWVPNPNSYTILDHIDTNIKNNHPSNLRWVADMTENQSNELSRRNRSIDIKVKQISLINGEVLKIWDRASVAACELGFRSGNILRVCRGKRKTAYGFSWKFVHE